MLDDIKETVREAAKAAWRALCSACVRLSEGTCEAAARGVLEAALPVLLEAMATPSDEVRRLSAKQLLKLCAAASAHLAPHTTALVPALLESLSVLEDPTLNYLQQQALIK